jgi:hypothetical protein
MSEDWKRFELHTTRHGETACMALLGEFELVGLDQFKEELRRAESRGGRAVLDLRDLTFTDPSASIDDSLGRDLVA